MGLFAAIADRFSPAAREHGRAVRVLESHLLQLEAAQRRMAESVYLGDRVPTPFDLRGDCAWGDRTLFQSGFAQDRKGGRNWPLVQTEQDLRLIRSWSRLLADTNVYARGFADHVVNFVVGTGFAWEVTLRGQNPGAVSTGVADADGDGRPDVDPDVAACQTALDEFRARSGWGRPEQALPDPRRDDATPPKNKEREAFERLVRDGEAFLLLGRGGASRNGLPWLRFLEPEQIACPPGEDQQGPWSFGVEVDPDDAERRLRYHALSVERAGAEGDYWDAADVIHGKVNVDGTIKRGLPDFFILQDHLPDALGLLTRMSKTAGVQAAIAYIRQHAPQVTGTQINRMLDSSAIKDPTRPVSPLAPDSTRYLTLHQVAAIIDISNQMVIQPPPANPGTPGFIQVQQQTLQAVGLRWGCPGYFSGNAGDMAAYTAGLVVGGPFERAAKSRQDEFAAVQLALACRVLCLAVESGRLTERQVTRVAVRVVAPEVAISNKLEGTQRRQILRTSAGLSPQTWLREEGYDPSAEAANTRAWERQFPDAAGAGGGMGELGGLFGEHRRPKRDRHPLRWLHESHGPPPRPGLVWDETSHRWVKPDAGGGANARTPGEDVPPELAKGLKARFAGFAEKAAGVLYRIDALVGKAMPGVEAVFDTPSDLEKFGYAPLGTGPVAAAQQMAAGDPIRAQLGISAHLAASLLSQGIAKAWVLAKRKRAAKTEAAVSEDLIHLAEALHELFALAHEWLGLDLQAPTAAEILDRLKANRGA